VDPGKLTFAHPDGVPEHLVTPELLEEPNAGLHRERYGFGVLERDARLAVERIRVLVPGRFGAPADALGPLAGDEGVEV
jgi:hypothetical protein